MPIRVGTIVKRYEPGEDEASSHFPCERYSVDYPDVLDTCVGIVIELDDPDDPDAVVDWVQRCRYHHKIGYLLQTLEPIPYLWEIGQIH